MLSIFCSPSRYVQGPDASRHLGTQMRAVGLEGPVFVLASARVEGLLGATWAESFAEVGLDYVIGRFGGECSEDEIALGLAAATACKARSVVGVGGGKALDAARAVASRLGISIVNCPTLASSDAPCSALSVVYAADGTVESYQFYPRNPDLVLVDTSVIARAPRRLLVSGMGDALATWFEARTVIEARSPNQVKGLTTASAGALAELCYRTLLADGLAAARSVEVQAVTPALERLVEANTLLSGLGFESGGLAIAHSVHNGITTAPGSHAYLHGEKVAFGLLVQLVAEGRPTHEIDEVIAFSTSVGLPTRLSQVGMSANAIDELWIAAKRTVEPGETAHHEPFEVTAELIYDAMLAADRYAAG